MLLADAPPAGIFEDPRVGLVFPQNRDKLTLHVIVDARGLHQGRVAQVRRFFDGFNQPAALSEMSVLPRLGQLARCGQLTVIGCTRRNQR